METTLHNIWQTLTQLYLIINVSVQVPADSITSSRLSNAHTMDFDHHLSELVGLTPLGGQSSDNHETNERKFVLLFFFFFSITFQRFFDLV